MIKKRLSWIDVTRGIAILLIVFGHIIVHSEHLKVLYKIIYSFHVMLFFMISGYLVNSTYKFKEFFQKKFFRIIIPYFIFGLLFLIPYMLMGKIVQDDLNVSSSYDIWTMIKGLIYGNGNDAALKQNSALWFLPALFTISIAYYWINKLKIYKKHPYILLLIIFIIGYASTYLKIIFPWGINTLLNIGIFYYIGMIMKKENLLEKIEKYKYSNLIIGILCIVALILAIFVNRPVSYIEYIYGNYIIFTFVAIINSLVIIVIARKIDTNKIIENLGRNTMGILIFHKIFVVLFQKIFANWLINTNWCYELLISLLILAVTLPITMICNKIMLKVAPWTMGEKRRIQVEKS